LVGLIALLLGAGFANAEIFQKKNLRLTLTGGLAPTKLPRAGTSPIGVTVGGKISTTDNTRPPKMKSLQIELNRNGDLDYTGLPICPVDSIQPASTSRALSACRSSLVGQGSFAAEITLTGQDPYQAKGKLLAFNGKENGKPVLFAQIYSPRPFATSFVIVFQIEKRKGTYGTALSANLPQSLRNWGNLTGIELRLSRKFSSKGKKRSYLSAGCPTPKGVAIASFPFVKTTFDFEGSVKSLSGAIKRSCKAK
jgi:hypothetical protein